jgi:hypothetical protein
LPDENFTRRHVCEKLIPQAAVPLDHCIAKTEAISVKCFEILGKSFNEPRVHGKHRHWGGIPLFSQIPGEIPLLEASHQGQPNESNEKYDEYETPCLAYSSCAQTVSPP